MGSQRVRQDLAIEQQHKALRPQGDSKTTKLLAGITSDSSMKELKV